ncbi:MAG: NUDIX domain-containing protein, partial [Parvibaculum sp.]
MQTRKTARALIFDTQGRLLLVRMHDPDVSAEDGYVAPQAYWVTVGGEIDEGEDMASAILREIAEETGLRDVRLGGEVWYTEHVLAIRGSPRLFQETFVLAHVDDTKLSTTDWTEDERRVIKGLKWWDVEKLLASEEKFFPTSLQRHIAPLARGIIPPTMIM